MTLTMQALKEFFKPNKELIPMKCHYFFFSAAEILTQPYLIIYLQQLGASVTVIGVINSVLPFSLMLCKPLVGAIADRLQRIKMCAIICLLITMVTYFVVKFIPQADRTHSITAHCNSSEINLDFCHIYPYDSKHRANSTCTLSCPETNSSGSFAISGLANVTKEGSCCTEVKWNSHTMSCLPESERKCKWECEEEICESGIRFGPTQLTYAIILLAASYSFEGSALSLSDAMTVEILGDKSYDYGKTRLFSSIGYGICAMVVGKLVDYVNEGRKVQDLSIVFYLAAVVYLLDCLSLSFAKNITFERSKTILRDSLVVFKKPDNILFAFACFYAGILAGITWTFNVIFMNEMGMSKLVMGFAFAIQSLGGEVIVFLLSSFIVRMIGSQNCMTIVFGSYCLRFVAYSFIYVPEHILPVELTEGFCYGLLLVVVTHHASKSADHNLSATMQGVFQGIFEGLGVGAGGIIGGVLYDRYGSHTMWRIMAISAAIGGLVHFILNLFLIVHLKRTRQRSES